MDERMVGLEVWEYHGKMYVSGVEKGKRRRCVEP